MQVHLRTRSRAIDYAFVNSAPDSRWWDTYADWTATERPCLHAVAEDGEGHWRVLLSGIPSVRTDSGGRLIYYTLVLEGAHDTAEQDAAIVLSLASCLLADLDEDEQGRGVLSDLLDGVCPAPEVDRLLAAPSEFAMERKDLTTRLLASVASLEPLPRDAPAAGRATFDRWIAGRSAPGASAAFLTRLSALLSGKEHGQAHLLNLVSEAEDVAELFPGRLAVLVEGGMVGDPAMPLERLPEPKAPSGPPAPPGSSGAHPKVRWRTPMARTSLAALILLLLLAGVFWIFGVPF
ncbi:MULTISPECIES: hypothetical protein [Streptomyces]|uniref:hypothetical protein n=1 Tax=Streptomyces TaxID=1883 RepID=UPI000CF1DB2F|nr:MULTISPECIES: hypothetical protein [Streptomyces]PPS67854.1 hypothetical protein BV882_34870 [Streptomyces sp. 46]